MSIVWEETRAQKWGVSGVIQMGTIRRYKCNYYKTNNNIDVSITLAFCYELNEEYAHVAKFYGVALTDRVFKKYQYFENPKEE